MKSQENQMDVTVLHDRVLIKKLEPEEKSLGGIVLAPTAVEPVFEATVISIGSGKPVKDGLPIPLTVKVNDRVIYNPHAVIPVKLNGEDLLVIKEEEIFAVIE
jgi:chaperonin GroES